MKIAYGTDIGEGDHAMEFGLLIAGGLTPAQVLLAATGSAADLLDAADKVGSIQKGHYADIVPTAGDSLPDSSQF